MSKLFAEVFPTLELNNGLKTVCADAEVIKISNTSSMDRLRIYLKTPHIIEKQDVYAIEREIARQLFAGEAIRITIHERFELSGKYNVKALMEEYRDSILEEFKHYDQFDYLTLYHADYEYPGDDMLRLVLDDTLVAREHKDDIIRILEKILNERCGLAATVSVEFKIHEKSKARAHSEHRMKEEILRIAGSSPGEVMPEGDVTVMDAPSASTGADDFSEAGASVMVSGKATGNAQDGKGYAAGGNSPDSGENVGNDPKAKQGTGKKEINKGFQRRKGFKESDDPDVVFGRGFDDEPMSIADIEGMTGQVTVGGKVLRLEKKETKSGKLMVIFDITDQTDTITVKMFPRIEQQEKLFGYLKEGASILIKAVADIDKYDGELSLGYVQGIKKAQENKKSVRMDNEPETRVELHCHTKMSDMDGVSDVAALMKRAAMWGHKALAITDHGVVQAFTDAFHALPGINKEYPDFKLIYGVEGYLVDDSMGVVVNGRGQSLRDTYVVFDIETTGFNPQKNNIIEIGAVKVENGSITDRFSTYVNPKEPIPFRITQLTTITDKMVEDAPYITELLPEIL